MKLLSWRSPLPWIVLVCTLVLLRQTVEYGFIGQDTYSILASCRVRSAADLVALFSERLMGGTHNLYRPLFNVSIALDQAVWGLWAPGYHLTDALFFAACALSSALLAERLLGIGARVGPYVAALAFLSFPAHFEVLPVIARRPDTMVFAFSSLALWAQLSERSLGGSRPSWAPAGLALLAMGSKENGLLVVPLCFLVALLYSPRPSFGARAAHAARALVPHAVLTAGFWTARSAIVVGLGGMRSRDTWGLLETWPDQAGGMLRSLLLPETYLTPSVITVGLVAALALALAAALALGRRTAGGGATRFGGTALVGATWLMLLSLMYATREVWRGWYVFQLVAPWVLVLGASAELLLAVFRGRGGPARVPAGIGLVLLSALLAWDARTSPLVHRYDEWRDQWVSVEAFYDDLERRIADVEPPALVQVPAFPPHHGTPPADRPFVHVSRNVTRNAIRAWCRLTLPDVRVRLVHTSQARVRPSDQLVLVSGEFPRRERPGANGD